jgi:hypothetical protein
MYTEQFEKRKLKNYAAGKFASKEIHIKFSDAGKFLVYKFTE